MTIVILASDLHGRHEVLEVDLLEAFGSDLEMFRPRRMLSVASIAVLPVSF